MFSLTGRIVRCQLLPQRLQGTQQEAIAWVLGAPYYVHLLLLPIFTGPFDTPLLGLTAPPFPFWVPSSWTYHMPMGEDEDPWLGMRHSFWPGGSRYPGR